MLQRQEGKSQTTSQHRTMPPSYTAAWGGAWGRVLHLRRQRVAPSQQHGEHTEHLPLRRTTLALDRLRLRTTHPNE